jgi:hypothetical protein
MAPFELGSGDLRAPLMARRNASTTLAGWRAGRIAEPAGDRVRRVGLHEWRWAPRPPGNSTSVVGSPKGDRSLSGAPVRDSRPSSTGRVRAESTATITSAASRCLAPSKVNHPLRVPTNFSDHNARPTGRSSPFILLAREVATQQIGPRATSSPSMAPSTRPSIRSRSCRGIALVRSTASTPTARTAGTMRCMVGCTQGLAA